MMLIRQLSLLMTSPADYHHFPLAAGQCGPKTFCVGEMMGKVAKEYLPIW